MRNEKTIPITVREVAEILGISLNSAYSAIKRGEIPSVKIGARILIPPDAPERILAQATARAPGTP